MKKQEWTITKSARELARACENKLASLDREIADAGTKENEDRERLRAFVESRLVNSFGFYGARKIEVEIDETTGSLINDIRGTEGRRISREHERETLRNWLRMFESTEGGTTFTLDADDVTFFGVGEDAA